MDLVQLQNKRQHEKDRPPQQQQHSMNGKTPPKVKQTTNGHSVHKNGFDHHENGFDHHENGFGHHEKGFGHHENGHEKKVHSIARSPLLIPRYGDLIGQTPLIDITSLVSNPKNRDVLLLAKCEFLNPGFSMKDRMVSNVLDRAEQRGLLRPGGTIVAASSGNTGASVAMLAAARGYRAVITTSPKCSKEKMDAIRAYGAILMVSEPGLAEEHPRSYMNMATSLAESNEGWFDVAQYENKDNPEGHFRSLGPEIWMQTKGTVTHFVAGGSTGGTISGTGRFLKSMNPSVKCILADPHGSIFHDYIKSGGGKSSVLPPQKPFLVEGVGKGGIPGCLDVSVIDDVVQVSDDDSFRTCHLLAKREGLLVGGSSGLNTFAAVKLANEMEEPAVIVTVLCDLGIKYLSKVFNEDWLKENQVCMNGK